MVDRKGSGEAGRATSRSCGAAVGVLASSACWVARIGSRRCSRGSCSRRASWAASSLTTGRAPPEGRVDLRDELAFTIDPETAKDFDDALTLHEDRVLVHIADVSWFVGAGTPLDRGAAARAFSVYVPGLVSPMLPPELSNDLCSLRPHLDRLCVTVEVELATGEARFYRSVIRSGARLTYGQAEAILAGASEPSLSHEALRRAERVTSDLRARRFGRGALRIESSEATFAFDGEGGVADAWREWSRTPTCSSRS